MLESEYLGGARESVLTLISGSDGIVSTGDLIVECRGAVVLSRTNRANASSFGVLEELPRASIVGRMDIGAKLESWESSVWIVLLLCKDCLGEAIKDAVPLLSASSSSCGSRLLLNRLKKVDGIVRDQ